MKKLTDQLVLLIYCFVSILLVPPDTAFLVAFLVALIYICAEFLAGRSGAYMVCSLVFLALSVVIPPLFVFFPIVFYNMYLHRHYVLIGIGVLLFLWHVLPFSIPLLLFLLLGCLLALLLQHRTRTYEELDNQFRKTRDDSTEFTLLLKQKNQALLDTQDYEVYTATLRERNRIAREIHDNVGHMLSRSILMTGAMKAMNKDAALNDSLLQLESTLNVAMNNVRESVHDLHDDSINLKDALEDIVNAFTFCPITMDYDMGYDIPREIKYSFITILKEALNNIIRHSNASDVHLIAREHPGLYQLAIEDNGSPGKQAIDSGLGLINMRERVSTLHGSIQIQTDSGFRIFITVPKLP